MTNVGRYNAIILAAFPELKKAFEDEEGIYSKTSVFVDFTNRAIANEEWTKLQKCFGVIDRVLNEEPDGDVFNAVCVSFIEHLDFTDPVRGKRAKAMMSDRMLTEWKSLEAYWKSLKDPRK